MEAKDTVMSNTLIWVEPNASVDIKNQLLAQAIISFAAGIKEVVEWVDKNWLDSSNLKQWQAKLKDWNISA